MLTNNLLATYWAQQNAGGLPSGYRRVEYLESNGEQYIDTGLLWKPLDWKLEFDYLPDSNVLFGVVHQNAGYGTWNGIKFSRPENTYRYYYMNFISSVFSPAPLSYEHITISCADGLLYGDTVINSNTFSDGTDSTNDINIYLFTWYDFKSGGPQTDEQTKNRKSGEVIISGLNGVERRRCIPVIRIADNKPGMYDLCGSICPLTGTPFYINSSTEADFTWGELS